MSRKTKEMSPD